MAGNYDPAKVACSPNYKDYEEFLDETAFMPSGPGGKTTNIENNEKGILETGLMSVIAKHQYAALGSDHDSHRQGIYTTNSVGDRD